MTFSEAVTDPIFLFNFPDSSAHEFIFYSNTIERPVLDWNLTNPNFPFGNNTIQINASEGNNTADSGFSIKLLGNYSDVSFDILIDGGSAADASSYGFDRGTGTFKLASLGGRGLRHRFYPQALRPNSSWFPINKARHRDR